MKYLSLAAIASFAGAANAATSNPIATPACAELTGLQKAVGLLNFFTLFEILAFIAICWSVGILFPAWYRALRRLLARVPLLVYEIALYLASLGCALSGWLLPGKPFEWGLASALLFPAAIIFSGKLRGWRANPHGFCNILMLAWSLLALAYQSQVLGFLAVAALMARMGFAVGIGSLCYAIGFTGRDVIAKASLTAFLVLATFTTLQITHWDIPYLAVFEAGGMWLGALVLFCGLLIMSSKWHHSGASYWSLQILTLIACSSALAIGTLWQLGILRGIGGTFLVLYLLEKPFEIPFAKRESYAALALLMSVLVIVGVYWAKQHMHLITPYLLF